LARNADTGEFLGLRQKARRVVDPDDAPELDDAFFERATFREGDVIVKRGRPKADVTKVAIKLRVDPDVIERYRASGPGWQTKMNDALRRGAPRGRKVG
jgi:uncharacterized protein (DUF4415 family)